MASRRSEVGAGEPVALPRPLFLFLAVSAALTCVAVLYSLVMRTLGFGLPYSFPYYFVPGQLASDLGLFSMKFDLYPSPSFYSGAGGYFMYPLPLFYLIRPMFLLGHAFYVFLAILLLLTGALVYALVRSLQAAGMHTRTLAVFVVGTVLLSYPLAFEYLRCNIEIVLFALVAFGVVAWWRDRPMLAALLFGVAGACKIYPLILVGLLFAERRWRAVVVAFATAVACTLASAWAFGPTIHDALAWDAFQLALFQKRYAGVPLQLGYDHSFFGLVKFLTLPWHPVLGPWVVVYTRVAALLALLLYFLRIQRLPRLNQVTVLTLLSITLPPVSYDYTLLAVYVPLTLLSMETVRRARLGLAPFPYATRYFLCFGILLTPLSFVAWLGSPYHAQVRCLCLAVLIWTALRHPIEAVEPVMVEGAVPRRAPAGMTPAEA